MESRRTSLQSATGRGASHSASCSSSSPSSTSHRSVRAPSTAGRDGGRRGDERRRNNEGVNGINGVNAVNDVNGGNVVNGPNGNNGVNGNNGIGGDGSNVPTGAAMVVDTATTPSIEGTTASDDGAPSETATTATTTTTADPLFSTPATTNAQMPSLAAQLTVVTARTAAFHGHQPNAASTIADAAADNAGADTHAAGGTAVYASAGAAHSTGVGCHTVSTTKGGGRGIRNGLKPETFGFIAPTMPGSKAWLARLRLALGRGWMVPQPSRHPLMARTVSGAAAATAVAPPAPPPSPMAATTTPRSHDQTRAPLPLSARSPLGMMRKVFNTERPSPPSPSSPPSPPSPSAPGSSRHTTAHAGGGTTHEGGHGLPPSPALAVPEVAFEGNMAALVNSPVADHIFLLVSGATETTTYAAVAAIPVNPTDGVQMDAVWASAVARARPSGTPSSTVTSNRGTKCMLGLPAPGSPDYYSINTMWLPSLVQPWPAAGAATAGPHAPTTASTAPTTAQNEAGATAAGTQAEALPSGMVTPPTSGRNGNQRPGTPHPAPLRGRHVEPLSSLRSGLQARVPEPTPPPVFDRRGNAPHTGGGEAQTANSRAGRSTSEVERAREHAHARAQARTHEQTQVHAHVLGQVLGQALGPVLRRALHQAPACNEGVHVNSNFGEGVYQTVGGPANNAQAAPIGSTAPLATESPELGPGPAGSDQVMTDAAVETPPGMVHPIAAEAAQAAAHGEGVGVWPADVSPMLAMELAAQMNIDFGYGFNEAVDLGSDAEWEVDGTPVSPTTLSPPSSMHDMEEDNESWTDDDSQ